MDDNTKQEMFNVLRDYALQTETEMKGILASGTKNGASSKLYAKQKIDVKQTSFGFRLQIVEPKYAFYVDMGRKGQTVKGPPVPVMVDWVTSALGLSGDEALSAAIAITISKGRKGNFKKTRTWKSTQGIHFLDPFRMLPDKLRAAFKGSLSKAVRDIIVQELKK